MFLETCRSGGKGLVDVLDFCVFSVEMDPIFLYLVQEYRLQPTGGRALALYDLFCPAGAPARLSVTNVLPPRDCLLPQLIQRVREPRLACVDAEADPPRFVPAPQVPGKHIFDGIAKAILEDTEGGVWRVESRFDPERGPRGSLPQGGLGPSQRQFVEGVWKRTVRPALVQAGFWKMATIGEP
jgi:hypothetical protein